MRTLAAAGPAPAGQAGSHDARMVGAPPGARTPYPWIKSPVLHPYSSRRENGMPGATYPGAACRGAACGSRTRILGLEGRHTGRCVNAASWFPEDSNLAPADLHSAALPDELENHRRTGRARTGDLVLPKHARYLLRHHPPIHGQPVSGPLRTRTGNLLLAGELLFPLELAAREAARQKAGGQPEQAL
jgi:hypothetical protein